MVHILSPLNQYEWHEMTERKIRYNSELVDYQCKLLTTQAQSVVLFHIIEQSFTMAADHITITIPEGSYTIAYYWKDRPYNLYFWRDKNGNYLASYFNIVRNTTIKEQMVSFEDLIIDILALPNGDYFILDEDELPEKLEQFENGAVKHALESLLGSMNSILSQALEESESIYRHQNFAELLTR